MAQTLTPKEIALELDVSPKLLRKFLREDIRGKGLDSPGKGKRWEIARKDLRSLKSRFGKWQEEKAKKVETPETPDAPESDVNEEITDLIQNALNAGEMQESPADKEIAE